MDPAEVARNGERFLIPAIFAPLARELVRFAELEPDDRILDLACCGAAQHRP